MCTGTEQNTASPEPSSNWATPPVTWFPQAFLSSCRIFIHCTKGLTEHVFFTHLIWHALLLLLTQLWNYPLHTFSFCGDYREDPIESNDSNTSCCAWCRVRYSKCNNSLLVYFCAWPHCVPQRTFVTKQGDTLCNCSSTVPFRVQIRWYSKHDDEQSHLCLGHTSIFCPVIEQKENMTNPFITIMAHKERSSGLSAFYSHVLLLSALTDIRDS